MTARCDRRAMFCAKSESPANSTRHRKLIKHLTNCQSNVVIASAANIPGGGLTTLALSAAAQPEQAIAQTLSRSFGEGAIACSG
ncbi:MAG: hypothetical protein HC878_00250 [Leptolyngbyaceae cyanobacterium SL_5_14]|nr:hypothetical protein [Leptolyngbyaceae cyanobacterium SL_5_14]